MAVKSPFQNSSSRWVRYSAYKYQETQDGTLYLTPTVKSASSVYDPLKNAETMVLDMLNVGMLCMRGTPDEKLIQSGILDFAEKYGLLGFITALSTTPDFMNYDTVYLPKNRYVRDEHMAVRDYTALFFPFQDNDSYNDVKPKKHYIGDDGSMRVSLAARDKPQAVEISYQRGYAERYDWLRKQFKDWAFSFCASFMYYDETDPLMQELHRQAMNAFDGIAPTYHIELFDKPTLVWDFHSLLRGIQMMFSFALTDERNPLRPCRHCNTVFAAQDPRAAFCSHECKNRHNVYKSRGRKAEKSDI